MVVNTHNDSEISDIHNFNIDIKNREVYLHSCLDGENEGGVDYRSAVIFEKNIRLYGN